MNTPWRLAVTAPGFTPLLGVLVGAAGGALYWMGSQIWPTSIAVVLSMLATQLLSEGVSSEAAPAAGLASRAGAGASGVDSRVVLFVFGILVKYDALMALSAANLTFAVPANVALGVIMIAGQASSRALAVSVLAASSHIATRPVSHLDLCIALTIGFAPAVLIGIPGLVGLAAAILARIALIAYVRRNRRPINAAVPDAIRQSTEVCFYLGALGAWAYI